MKDRVRNVEHKKPGTPVTAAIAVAVLLACFVVIVLLATTPVGRRLAGSVVGGFILSGLVAYASVCFAVRKSRLAWIFWVVLAVYAVGLLCFFVLSPIAQDLWISVVASLLVILVVSGLANIARRFDKIRELMEDARSEARKLYENAVLRLFAYVGFLVKDAPLRYKLTAVLVLGVVILAAIGVTHLFPGPRLLLQPRTLDFRRDKDSLTLRIASSDDRSVLGWELDIPDHAKEWLFPEETEGTATRDGATIEVSIRRHMLDCAEYLIKIPVLCPNGRGALWSVKIDNTMDPRIPVDDVVFDVGHDSRMLTISNEGAGDLCWAFKGLEQHLNYAGDDETLQEYISVSPATGTLSFGPRESHDIEIRVDRQRLVPRDDPYVARLRYQFGCCGSSSQEEDYWVVVVRNPPPSIEINEGNPLVVDPIEGNELTVTLKNDGEVPAPWRFSESSLAAPWISGISPKHGNLPVGEAIAVAISIKPCELPSEPERQDLKIVVSDGGGEILLPCDLRPAKPTIDVDRSRLDIGNAPSGTLRVSNDGCGTLDWHTVWDDVSPGDDKDPKDDIPDWIREVDPMSGTCIEGDDPDRVTVTVQRGALPPGPRAATLLFIQDGAGGDSEPVRVCIDIEPNLEVTPSRLSFGYSKDSSKFTIRNTGSGTLFWEIARFDAPWLSLTPIDGSCDDSPNSRSEVNVTIDRSELSEAKESVTLFVVPTEGGGQQEVEITVCNRRAWDFEVCPHVFWAPIGGVWQAGYGIGFSGQWPDFDLGLTYLGIATEDELRTELYGSFGSPIATWHFCTLRLAGGVGGATKRGGRGEQERTVCTFLLVGLGEYEMRLWDVPEGQLSLGVSASVYFLPRESQWRFGVGLSLHVEKKR